jgi:hypothetical protein
VAKEKQQQPANKVQAKPKGSETPRSSGPVSRNAIIIAGFLILFFAVYQLNASYGELRDLFYEKQAIENNPTGNAQRLDEINRRVHEIKSDTGFVKMLLFGYFYDVHNVAFGYQEQIDHAIAEIKEDKAKFGQDADGPITREDKLASKVHTFRLLDFVNTNCPPNSVILLPPADSLAGNPNWYYIYDPIWVEYFIYPRLCIETGQEKLYPNLARRITHVLIVKGIGYDKLNYDVPMDKREPLCLLPINKPAEANKTSN